MKRHIKTGQCKQNHDDIAFVEYILVSLQAHKGHPMTRQQGKIDL